MRRAPAIALALALVLALDARAEQLGKRVGVDQKLGAAVPLDIALRDEEGCPVALGALLRDRPAVIAMVYYECPMLCDLVLQGLVGGLKPLSLEAGKDFTVLAVSFAANETPELARGKKKGYLNRYARGPEAAAGFRFLTGDEREVARLADAIGFRYAFDPETGEYQHPSALAILSPEGRISRYLFGFEYAPRDLKLALVEAGEGKVGSAIDRAVLLCMRYDPATGKYGWFVLGMVRAGGALTVAALVAYIVVSRVRERRAACPG